jgi:hypothetical protein
MSRLIQNYNFMQSISNNFRYCSISIAATSIVYNPTTHHCVVIPPSPEVVEIVTKTSSLLLGMEKPYLIMGGMVLFAGSIQVIKVGSTLIHAYQALGNVTWHWGTTHVTSPLSTLGVTTVDVPTYTYRPIYHAVESTVLVPRFLTSPYQHDLGSTTNIIHVPVTKTAWVPVGPTPLELLSSITPMEAAVTLTVVCVTGYLVYRACSHFWVDELLQYIIGSKIKSLFFLIIILVKITQFLPWQTLSNPRKKFRGFGTLLIILTLFRWLKYPRLHHFLVLFG